MMGLKKTSSAGQPVTLKHVPERTCIACHEVRPKRELIRLVHTAEGVDVDASGRKSGRGAYLCLSSECWQKGVNKGKLEHALRGRISAENRARLITEFGKAGRGTKATPSQTGEAA
jgi:predicted RNA-binding protein YlxR (DUF448 family)